MHGDDDRIVRHGKGRRGAELTGAPFVGVAGAGHLPHVRDPALINRLIRDFVERSAPR